VTQPFVYPRCRYESTFDPWVAPACCPNCGYTPLPVGSELPDARFLGKSDWRLSWIDVVKRARQISPS